MTVKHCTNLLVSRNLVLEIILFVREASTKLLFQTNITKEELNQIFEDIEISLCKIADEIAIVIDEEILSPVTSYQEEIKIVTQKIQNVIDNCEDYSTLTAISRRLLNFFREFISTEGTYLDTSKILDNLASICNRY
ncbi:hypothetical protein FACHB389_03965 [Nostoc calcicola FACHB-389]|nr:hypothetical protein [Nostoc calcicola FACHB-3891]OKH41661.1 hypothetical protein FACHB389_03965 [Nostoc calcicola FACHB-389]